MVALDAVVDDAKLAAFAALRPTSTKLAKQSLGAQPGHIWPHAKCHVDRATPGDVLAAAMRHLGARAARPAGAGSRTPASAAHALIVEGELARRARHDL